MCQVAPDTITAGQPSHAWVHSFSEGRGTGKQYVSGTAVPDEEGREGGAGISIRVAQGQWHLGTCSCSSSLKKRDRSDACSLTMRQAEPQRARAKCAASAVAICEKRLHLLRVDTPHASQHRDQCGQTCLREGERVWACFYSAAYRTDVPAPPGGRRSSDT